MLCKFGHLALEISSHQNPRGPPCRREEPRLIEAGLQCAWPHSGLPTRRSMRILARLNKVGLCSQPWLRAWDFGGLEAGACEYLTRNVPCEGGGGREERERERERARPHVGV